MTLPRTRVRRSLRPSSACTAMGCWWAPGGSWLRAWWGAVLVVVPFVGGQDLSGVGFVHDEDMVEDLAPDAADHPHAVGVHPRGPRRAHEDLHLLGLEDGVEGLPVLAAAVTKQEAQELHACAQVGGKVPCLLHRPLASGVRGDAGDVQAPGAVFEKRWRVQLASVGSVEMEEVDGDVPWAWLVRNSLQVGPEWRGAGPMPAACRISQAVDAVIGCPSRVSSPWLRLCPRCAFSRASCRISFLSVALVGGRPVRVCRALWSHLAEMNLRCQAGSVPGVTGEISRQRRRGIRLERGRPARTGPRARS